ncbi:DHHC palmitoyltransferase-domain-containing protein [Chaetomium sp. MPI-SDFR-AT-0129]|nr:DHHC palmitoyltransferase-domain-containing protein [Chaetomium sp. MPI-SDFR-AT-0129]
MGALAKVAAAVLGLSFMVFVTFFGRLPAFRRTPVAWLYRLVWVHLPNGLIAIDERLTGGRTVAALTRFSSYIMYDRHPTVLIFFILLLTISTYLYLPSSWPLMAPIHKILSVPTILFPYLFLYLSAASDPGTITPSNLPREMARYPFDFSLFHPGARCRTCPPTSSHSGDQQEEGRGRDQRGGQLKPARSKHCSLCSACIARCDHHCIFINNCVGAGNHHYFLLLLLSTAILTLYGGLLGTSLMTGQMRARFPGWQWAWWRASRGTLYGNRNGVDTAGMPFTDWLITWSWGMQDGGRGSGGGVAMGAVTLLALMTSPLVWGLLGYHLWLVYCGTTTNESMKWADWQVEMDEGGVFKRRVNPEKRERDLGVEPAWTRWPVEAEQVLVRTGDGKPPRGEGLVGEGPWEAVWRLRDVENLYDLGWWDNLVDVLWPYYMFRDPYVPVAEDRVRRKKKRRARKIILA